MSPGKCRNCGAPLETASDGRSTRCVYCGASEAIPVDASRLAAALRAESSTAVELFERLAARLGTELPELTQVERAGGFLQAKRPVALEVSFDDRSFRLHHEKGRVLGERREVVRGVVVKTEVLALDAWLQSLCEALSSHASSSARTKDALLKIGV